MWVLPIFAEVSRRAQLARARHKVINRWFCTSLKSVKADPVDVEGALAIHGGKKKAELYVRKESDS